MNIQSVKIISSPTLTQSQFQNSMDKSPKILLATSQVPHLTPGQGTLPTKPVIAKDFVQREPFLRSKLGQSLKDLMALIVQNVADCDWHMDHVVLWIPPTRKLPWLTTPGIEKSTFENEFPIKIFKYWSIEALFIRDLPIAMWLRYQNFWANPENPILYSCSVVHHFALHFFLFRLAISPYPRLPQDPPKHLRHLRPEGPRGSVSVPQTNKLGAENLLGFFRGA